MQSGILENFASAPSRKALFEGVYFSTKILQQDAMSLSSLPKNVRNSQRDTCTPAS